MATKTCTVSFTSASGARHGVEVCANSLYEAAIIGVDLLRKEEWVETIGPGTCIEIEVRHPATTHRVTLLQLRRWVDGIAASPEETLRKRRLKALLPDQTSERQSR
jgi:hypothetical protein